MTKHPLLTGQSFFSGERAARIASTKANYLYAENIFKNASRNIWDDYENTVSKITEEFNEAAASYYSVKPELVDDNALSLLNSGIMTPEDVFRMSDKYANNPTMRRLIADHAGKMADDTKFEGSRASLLSFSAKLAHEKTGHTYHGGHHVHCGHRGGLRDFAA